MSKLTDIKRKIDELDGGAFQNLCDAYLACKGYGNGYSLGMHTGTDKTAKGNPDTYFLKDDNNYVFTMYTTQKSNFIKKAQEDIEKCFDSEKTGVEIENIVEIIYCHTYGRLSAGEDKQLRDLCASKGIKLTIVGIDTLGNDLFFHYPMLAKDILGITVDTGQITDIDSFVQSHDKNKLSAPLETTFMFREKELEEATELLSKSNILVVYGPAGVGKTRFSLKLCETFANKEGYEIICIKSNGLEILEDLISTIESDKKYITLIDDANELAGLRYVLDYLIKEPKNCIFKIIITVRDYARQDVIRTVLDFDKPKKIKIGMLSDDNIKKLMEEHYGITNSLYINRIIEIAEGNTRIAMLAGKMVSESGKLESIRDASELYNNYYSKQLDNILSNSQTEIYSAGVIAFLQAIRLDNLERLADIFASVPLTPDQFCDDIKHLYSLELVDICNDKAVRISDQSFSNFLIKYVFIDKSLISLDLMVRICFEFNKIKTISACNILMNVFSDSTVRNYIEEQINKAWDYLKDDTKKFEPFFKAFHMIRPTETLLTIHQKIQCAESVVYDVSSAELKKDDGKQITDETISILCNFQNHEQLPEAIELLLAYYEKRPDLFEEFYCAFVRELGIDKNSYYTGYFSVKTVVDHLCQLIRTNRNNNTLILFISIASYYLKLSYSQTEGGRRNTVTFYTIPLAFTDTVVNYRNALISELKNIYEDGKFKAEIESVLKNYCNEHTDNINYEIIDNEQNNILSFLPLLDSGNLSHCVIVDHLKTVIDRTGKEYDLSLFSPFIDSSKYRIFCTLKGNRLDFLSMDFEEADKYHHFTVDSLIKDYSVDDFLFLLYISKEAESILENDTYYFSKGLYYVFELISNNRSLYIKMIETYIQLNTPCNLVTSNFIEKLFDFLIKLSIAQLFAISQLCADNFVNFIFEKPSDRQYLKKSCAIRWSFL